MIKDELTEAEIDTFIAIASELRAAPALRGVTLRDFLNACAVAYEGAGYGIKILNIVAQYRSWRLDEMRDSSALTSIPRLPCGIGLRAVPRVAIPGRSCAVATPHIFRFT